MNLLSRRSVVGSIAAAAAARPLIAAESRPNFVFILMDDLGWRDVGCYGSDFYETPQIDRLASQGMRFTNAYAACPVCSPTRASIMTGKYPARLRLTNFIPGRSPRPFAKLIPPEFEQQLPHDEITIAEVLRKAGYATAEIGKWHLGARDHGPDRQGFEVAFSTGGRHVADAWNVNPPHKPRPGEPRAERLTEEAEKFIRDKRDRPFFLYLTHHLPHIPLEAAADRIAKYREKLQRPEFRARAETQEPAQNNAVYAAMMENADDLIGRVLRTLDETGVARQTMVVFTSDNGGLTAPEFANRPTTSNAPLREGKGHLYEGGIRVPLIVRWPGHVRAGSRCEVPVSSVDHYPTMLELAGVRDEAGHRSDGETMAPLLAGRNPGRARSLYWHYPHYSNQGGDPGAAIRHGDYKLIEFYEDRRLELYNLRDDIGERQNLASKMRARVGSMKDTLHSWLADVRAIMPSSNPNYDPARQMQGLRWVPKT